jgi:CRISPR system Cascade subunit CasC
MTEHFLNLHLLVTSSVANANRDDTGAPKQVTYGGVTRHRLSSQAMTRAKRIDFELAAGGEQVSYRAKGGMVELALTQAAELASQSGQPLTAEEENKLQSMLANGVSALVMNRKKAVNAAADRAARNKKARRSPTADAETEAAETGEEAAEDTGKKETLTWLAEHEVRDLVANSLTELRGGAAAGDFVNKAGRTQSLSIAAFGRMFAFRPDLQNEAAVQRSHAFTTHAADIEPDYFTAVNDLPQEGEGGGAGHLDMAQYGGGTFYWHANVDRRQLWTTWIAGDDDTATHARLQMFFTSLLLALPSGRKTTTAHKTVPDAVLAVPAASPVALHQAFEAPVTSTGEGFRQPSVERLLAAHEQVLAFTPRQFPVPALYAGTLAAPAGGTVTVQPSLDALVDACVDWAMTGR